MGAMSPGFGVLAGLVVGGGAEYRLLGVATTTVSCFGVGLLVSEWAFGGPPRRSSSPNIDGLVPDEALLAS